MAIAIWDSAAHLRPSACFHPSGGIDGSWGSGHSLRNQQLPSFLFISPLIPLGIPNWRPRPLGAESLLHAGTKATKASLGWQTGRMRMLRRMGAQNQRQQPSLVGKFLSRRSRRTTLVYSLSWSPLSPMINTNILAFVGTNRTQGLATSGLFSARPLWTKDDAGKLPHEVVNKAMHYLNFCSPDFPANTRTEMLKVGLLSSRTQFYAQTLLEYATTVSSFEGSCQHVVSPLPTRLEG